VSLRTVLGRVLLAAMLQFGALAGVKMTPEDIEKIMSVMHRTKVVQIVKKEGER